MKQTVKYNLNKLRKLPVMLMMGGMIVAGCEKEKTDPQKPDTPQQPEKHNVEIMIDGARGNGGGENSLREQVTAAILDAHQADPAIDTVFIIPYGDWSWIRGPNQTAILQTLKGVRRDYSKTWGRGDFTWGIPTGLSDTDSLFLVNNGWTINQTLANKGLQKQR